MTLRDHLAELELDAARAEDAAVDRFEGALEARALERDLLEDQDVADRRRWDGRAR